MGDSKSSQFRPIFNGSLRIEGRPEKLTSHAGLVLLRELDERLGITTDLANRLVDKRSPHRVKHSMSQMLRTATYAMAIDSAHATAAAARGDDAAFQMATSDRRGLSMLDDDAAVASQPTLSRLFSCLSSEANLPKLRGALFDSAVAAVHATTKGEKLDQVTLDIDSYPIRVHGNQSHWLDLELRPGNVHTAKGAETILTPLIDRTREELSSNVAVRGDAGFVNPELLDMLEDKDVPYALRLPTNDTLKEFENIHAVRPPGRPPGYERIWAHEIDYRALRWKEKRRVVLVVVEQPGELFLRSFFIVTNFDTGDLCGRDVLDFYRERGTMEAHIGEMQSVISGRLSSTNRKKSSYKKLPVTHHEVPIDPERVNAAALCLHGLSFNLLTTFRSLAGSSDFIDEPPELGLKRARTLLLTAGRVLVSGRQATLVIRDVAMSGWRRVMDRIAGLYPRGRPLAA